jgi:hypothetical protein
MSDENEREPKRMKNDDIDFVKDGLSTTKIRDTVKSIREYITKHKDEQTHENIVKELTKQHGFFSKRYPMLFNMATNKNDFDFQSLEYFLNKRDDIINNVTTVDDASKQIGQEWFNKYVDLSKLDKK